jgi:hypothetical protein
MQTIAGNFIVKEPIDLLYHQATLAKLLLTFPKKFTNESSFENVRSTTFRLVIIIVERIRHRTIVNYISKPVSMNVLGGPLLDLEDTNPVEYRRLMALVKVNNENGKVNNEQLVLKLTREEFFPEVEQQLIAAYSKHPMRYEELRDYLILGRYEPEDRARIYAAIVNNSGVALPPFLDTPASVEEIEKEKSKKEAEKIETTKTATPKVEEKKERW